MTTQLADIAKIVHGEGDYSSKLVSLVDRKPGELLTNIEGFKRASGRDYTTVQVSEDQDIDLNSDLVYCNHSCDPNVVFDVKNYQVRVVENKSLKRGDDITFFYPSTEWNMDQPFQCHCGSERCLGSVNGARYLDEATLSQYWLNSHIEGLLAKRKDSDSSNEGSPKMSNSA